VRVDTARVGPRRSEDGSLHGAVAAEAPPACVRTRCTVTVLVANDILEREPVTASAEESCRSAAERMAQAGVGRLVVVAEDDPKRLVGIVTRSDLLKPRATRADEEERRERFFDLRFSRTSAPNRP